MGMNNLLPNLVDCTYNWCHGCLCCGKCDLSCRVCDRFGCAVWSLNRWLVPSVPQRTCTFPGSETLHGMNAAAAFCTSSLQATAVSFIASRRHAIRGTAGLQIIWPQASKCGVHEMPLPCHVSSAWPEPQPCGSPCHAYRVQYPLIICKNL